MDRTERFYLIERLLQTRKVVTRDQFLEALGVSLATLKRDLEYLRSRLRAPITWNAEKQGYEMAPREGAGQRFELPGLWFNESEAYALLTMQQLVSDLQPGLLAAHVAPLKARLTMLLEEGEVAAAEVNRRIRVVRQSARRMPEGVFEVVAAAVLRRRRLRMTYRGRGSGERTERVVSPQRLLHYRDNWYLDAWCHVRDDLRRFAIDAIEHPEMIGERAKAVDLKAIERTLGSGYGIFSGEANAWASLRFTPERARWVAHEVWHPAQRARFDADGSYLLEVPYADARELVMDVLKYGGDVEVLGPPALRERVRAEAAKILSRGAITDAHAASKPHRVPTSTTK